MKQISRSDFQIQSQLKIHMNDLFYTSQLISKPYRYFEIVYDL
jgi:hypothetical protein